MADVPRLEQPYPNMRAPGTGIVPKGPKPAKISQAQQALQGLIGAK